MPSSFIMASPAIMPSSFIMASPAIMLSSFIMASPAIMLSSFIMVSASTGAGEAMTGAMADGVSTPEVAMTGAVTDTPG